MREYTLSDKVEQLLKNHSRMKTPKKMDTALYDKALANGLLKKPKYTLPPHDTIGRELFKASKFKPK